MGEGDVGVGCIPAQVRVYVVRNLIKRGEGGKRRKNTMQGKLNQLKVCPSEVFFR